MNDQSYPQLLRAYAQSRTEVAFDELVRRHVDCVYPTALRMVRDTHLAEDVTQAAFLALARNADTLVHCAVLSGWLHHTARNLAAQTVRSDVRRRAREQEAATMNELLSVGAHASWQDIAPHLDDALDELGDIDRDALLLRYFEKKSAQEMGNILGISTEAAQKRVNRAVDRLRELFLKRKVTIGASGLVGLISINAVQSAPVGLAGSISAAALGGAAVSASTIIAAAKTITMTATQKLLFGIVLVATVATPVLVQSHDQAKLSSLDERQRGQAAQLEQLRAEIAQLARTTSAADTAATLPGAQFNELLRLRGQAGELQLLVKDLSRQRAAVSLGGSNSPAALAQVWAARAKQLKQWLEQNPSAKIPELRFVQDQNWIDAVYSSALDNDEEFRRAISNVRANAELHALDILSSALRKYAAANGGQMPPQLADLSPYFSSPLEDAILDRYELVPANSLAPQLQHGNDDWLITQKAPVDEVWDPRMSEGLTGGTMADCRVTNRWQ